MAFDVTAPTFPPKFRERYRVGALLGEGGMGVVYRAHQIALDREVAVKVLKSESAEDEERFLREGRLLASLNCPQIVRVLDADADAGRLWLVCELISGETLRVRHERLPLSTGQVLEITLEVMKALEEAHARGIVHRDVKPENVILSPDGSVKLADFGLARDVRSGESLTTSGIVLGTPHYIAPEQVRGLPAGPASDQYAIGVMLYWLLTGTHPVDGPTALEIMMRKSMTVPQPAHAASPRVPRALSVVIDRALAIEPGDRFGTITELAAELDRVRQHLAPGAPSHTHVIQEDLLPSASRTAALPSIPPAPAGAMVAIVAVLLLAVLGLGLKIARDAQRLAVRPTGRPPAITVSDVHLTRVNGEPCLAVRAPVSTALAVELITPKGSVPLTPVVGDPDSLHFRVDPAQLLAPVRLDLTAVDGSRVTTSLIWPGLLAELAEHGELLKKARKLTEAEHLFALKGPDLLGELPQLHSTWTRLTKPLRDLAPVLLDHPDVPLARKKQLYDALVQVKILDRICREEGYAPILPEGIFGRLFGAGAPQGKKYFETSRSLSVTTPVEHLLTLAEPVPDAVPSLEVPPPPPGAKQVLLELDPGELKPGIVLWISIGSWTLLITDENQVEIQGLCRLGLDPRIPAGEMTATYQVLPNAAGKTVIRALTRVALRAH